MRKNLEKKKEKEEEKETLATVCEDYISENREK